MDEWCRAAELAVSRKALRSATSAPPLCSFQKLKRKATCAKSPTIEKSILQRARGPYSKADLLHLRPVFVEYEDVDCSLAPQHMNGLSWRDLPLATGTALVLPQLPLRHIVRLGCSAGSSRITCHYCGLLKQIHSLQRLILSSVLSLALYIVMSFASLGEKKAPESELSTTQQVRQLLGEMQTHLQAAEQQLQLLTHLSKQERARTYVRVQTASHLAGKIQSLLKELPEAKADKWRQDLGREVGRLTRLTNAFYRAEQSLSDSSSEEGDAFLSEASQQQADTFEVELHEGILEERDQRITLISSSILQVNSLFKEISLLVNDQGQTLDRIEEHMSGSVQHSKRTVQELEKAAERGKGNKQRQCCLALLTVVLLLVIALVSESSWRPK